MLNDVSMICNSLPCNDVDYIFNTTDYPSALSTSVIKSTLNPIAKCFIPSFLANVADEKNTRNCDPEPYSILKDLKIKYYNRVIFAHININSIRTLLYSERFKD